MARFFFFLIGLVLFGIGILAGGCSILFTPDLFMRGEFNGSDFLPIWGAGILLAVGGIWLGAKAFRSAFRDSELQGGETTGQAPDAPPRKDPPDHTS